MAPVTDLAWSDISTALGPNNIFVFLPPDAYNPQARVLIDIGKLTNQPVFDLSCTGVITFLFKLHEAAVAAQVTVNNGKTVGEKLVSFIPSAYGTASNNAIKVVTQMQSQVKLVPLGVNQVIAVNG